MPKYILAAYLRRERRIRVGAIRNAQLDILKWSQEVAELDAAIDAALDDGVNLVKEGAI